MPADTLEALREHKVDALAKLQHVAAAGAVGQPHRASEKPPSKALTEPTVRETPAAQLDAEWAAAMDRARGAFAEHGVTPSQGTLEAATWLEMGLARGWDDSSGINEPMASEWLAELYLGRAIGRIGESGRPVLKLAREGAR